MSFQTTQTDCKILLDRALLNRPIWVFGEDGLGQHGRSNFPIQCFITDINVQLDSEQTGLVFIDLDAYDSQAHGHASTDRNLMCSLAGLLQAQLLPTSCLTPAAIELQGRFTVAFNLDVESLING